MVLSLYAVDSNDVLNAGFSDLTVSDQADIIKIVAQKKANKSGLHNLAKVEEAQKWVDLGSSIGKGLAASSKELGIAVNEFSESTVGKLTMWLIVFSIIGESVIQFLVGMLFIIIIMMPFY